MEFPIFPSYRICVGHIINNFLHETYILHMHDTSCDLQSFCTVGLVAFPTHNPTAEMSRTLQQHYTDGLVVYPTNNLIAEMSSILQQHSTNGLVVYATNNLTAEMSSILQQHHTNGLVVILQTILQQKCEVLYNNTILMDW